MSTLSLPVTDPRLRPERLSNALALLALLAAGIVFPGGSQPAQAGREGRRASLIDPQRPNTLSPAPQLRPRAP
jgi:hypothetical protein